MNIIPQTLNNSLLNLKRIIKESSKNIFFVLYDYFYFKRKERITVNEYINFKFDSASKEFRNSFLPYWKALKYWEILNPDKYAGIARNKFLTNMVLTNLGIPTTKIIIYYNPEFDENIDLNIVNSYNGLVNLLKQNNITEFVLKPADESDHGYGVTVCRELIWNNDNLYIKKYNGELILLKELINKEPLIFEEVIKQNKQFDSFNPSSVNTIRFVTTLYPDHKVNFAGIFIKIGRLGKDVDNAGNGGNIDVAVNKDTGVLYNAIKFDGWDNISKITNHPDTNTQIENVKIENWDEIINTVKKFQMKIPLLKTIGWDIAMTDQGPIVIEINHNWDSTGQLFLGKGWKEEIINCYNAWEKYYGKRN